MSALTDMVTKVREAVRRVLARPAAYVAGEWERRAPRERRAIAVLGATILGMGTLFLAWWMFSSVSDLQDDNAAMRDALKAIAGHRDEYLEAKMRSAALDARIGVTAQLTAIRGSGARKRTSDAETNERPRRRRPLSARRGIKIHQVDLQSFTKFLRRLETGRASSSSRGRSRRYPSKRS